MAWPITGPINIKDYLSLAFSLVALILSIVVFIKNKQNVRISLTYAFLNEWRSPALYEATMFIRNEFKNNLTESIVAGGVRNLEDETAKKFRLVSFFCDYVGVALVSGILDEVILLSTIGQPVVDLWRILSPIIKSERSLMKRDPSYQAIPIGKRKETWQGGFEHFAETARRFSARRAIRVLGFVGEVHRPKPG